MKVDIPTAACPTCGKLCDRAAGPDGCGPVAGDLTICVYCGDVAQFARDLSLRPCDHGAITSELQRQIDAVRAKLASVRPASS